MRNVTTKFKQLLSQNKRNYINSLNITLADSTQLNVANDNIMDGGLDVDDAVSQDNEFTALGSTIVGSCNVILYDITEKYSDYDFLNARVVVKTNLYGADSSDLITFGTYTVDNATYSESSVNLTLLDNMCQFDREYASYNIYTSSTTLFDIVTDACTKCGVLYDSSMTNFPNKDFVVPQAPKDDCTYREVIGWCATIAGCFARMTSDGKLKFDWFNVDAFATDEALSTDGGIFDSANPYATGDNVNGGTFNPWNDPSSKDGGAFTDRNGIHYLASLSTQNIDVDDVVITGIQVTYDVEEYNSTTQVTSLLGTDDYVVSITDNPFVTESNYQSVLSFLQPILIGLTFRPCNITMPNNPTIEAGDVGYVWDTKGIQHRILITRATFNPSELQNVVCGAESSGKNSSGRLTEVTKAFAKSRRMLNEEKSIREQMEEDFARRIANSRGLYWSKVENAGGGYTVYAHDKQLLADSSTVLKINSGAIATTGNYTGDDSTTQWFGFEFDGIWLANIISTIGIDFDWGVGGKLTIQDRNGNETFFADADTGVVRIKATEFSLTDGTTLASVQNSAVSTANSYTDTQLGNYRDTVNAVVANLQSQIDGQVMTWYYDYEPTMSNAPANAWTTTALRQQHEGDVFYWKSKGYAYRFMQSDSTWGWTLIQDTDITAAIAKAENAQDTADHKRRVFVTQPVPPYDIGDLWAQGSSGDLYRCETARASGNYVAGDWKKATKYTDDSTFTAFRDGTYATFVTNTNTALDKKITTYYRSTPPSSANQGDLFIDSDDGKLYRYNGEGGWAYIQDPDIQTALTNAADAQSTADSKIITFAQASQPTAADIGDLWIDTDDNNKMYRWSGSSWVRVTDNSGLKAFQDGTYASFVTATNTALGNKITTYYQASAPSSAITGDLWIDTDDSNKLYRYNGSSWISVRDSGIQTAITAAGDAQATADSKIITFAQASQPTATDVGDLWIDTDDANKMYRWNGTAWVQYTDSSAVDALEIGGRNIILDTGASQTATASTATGTSGVYRGNTSTRIFSDFATDRAVYGDTITVSFDYKLANNSYSGAYIGPNICKSGSTSYYSGNLDTEYIFEDDPTVITSGHYSSTAKLTVDQAPPYRIGVWLFASQGARLTISNFKVEFGNKETSWTPAPEDVDSAIQAIDTALDQEEIFNRLTNNGQAQGIYLQNGKLYLNFEYAVGQTLKLGGANNANGLLEVYAADGTTKIGTWGKDGFFANTGGKITSKNGKVYFDLDNNELACSKLISAGTQPYKVDVGSITSWEGNTVNGVRIAQASSEQNGLTIRPVTSTSEYCVIETPTWLRMVAGNATGTTKNYGTLLLGQYNVGLYRYITRSGVTSGYGYVIDSDGDLDISSPRSLYFTIASTVSVSASRVELPVSSKCYCGSSQIATVSSSSRRYKHNIKPLSENRDAHKLLELPVVEFEWNEDHELQYEDMRGKVVPGIIAEDVAEIYPSAVIHKSDTGEIESWDERRLIPGMLALIQEQDKKLKDQENQINDLKSRLEKMERVIMNLTNDGR